MSELLEFGCVRMLSENEEARARIEADIRREIAESEKSVARKLLERDRRRSRAIDRDEDHDLHSVAARYRRPVRCRLSGIARARIAGSPAAGEEAVRHQGQHQQERYAHLPCPGRAVLRPNPHRHIEGRAVVLHRGRGAGVGMATLKAIVAPKPRTMGGSHRRLLLGSLRERDRRRATLASDGCAVASGNDRNHPKSSGTLKHSTPPQSADRLPKRSCCHRRSMMQSRRMSISLSPSASYSPRNGPAGCHPRGWVCPSTATRTNPSPRRTGECRRR